MEEVFSTSLNLNFLRITRVIRLVRVTKVIRLVRFFQGLRYLLSMMVDSLWMLFWTVAFLSFMTYIFAIVFMQGVNVWIDTDDADLKQRVEEYYGSLQKTMFTLMMAVTGGQPWQTFLRPLQEVSRALTPFFLSYVVIALYGIFNIVSAVFVEHARELKELDRDMAVQKRMCDAEAFGKELRALFAEQGLCPDDVLDFSSFADSLANSEVQMFLIHHIDVADAELLFLLLDENEEGSIAIDDFVFGCQKITGRVKGMDICLLYDQVLATTSKITSVLDQQRALNLDVRQHTNKVAAEMCNAMEAVREMSADFYVQIHGIRRLIEGSADGVPKSFTGI